MVNVLENRDQRIIDAAVSLAKENGYQWLTRDEVARVAGVGAGTVNSAYGSMVELKRAVLREAVEKEIVEIIAQGMTDRHPIVANISDDLRSRVALFIATA